MCPNTIVGSASNAKWGVPLPEDSGDVSRSLKTMGLVHFSVITPFGNVEHYRNHCGFGESMSSNGEETTICMLRSLVG